MNEIITQTAHMTAEIIINKCKHLRGKDIDSEDIDFIHAWDELIGAYGILKDKGWNDTRILKYLVHCKDTLTRGDKINFSSIKKLGD